MSFDAELSEVKKEITELEIFSAELRCTFDLDREKKRLSELALASENPDTWGKPPEMQKLNKEKSILEKSVNDGQSKFVHRASPMYGH